jgi:hypothetical protein
MAGSRANSRASVSVLQLSPSRSPRVAPHSPPISCAAVWVLSSHISHYTSSPGAGVLCRVPPPRAGRACTTQGRRARWQVAPGCPVFSAFLVVAEQRTTSNTDVARSQPSRG